VRRADVQLRGQSARRADTGRAKDGSRDAARQAFRVRSALGGAKTGTVQVVGDVTVIVETATDVRKVVTVSVTDERAVVDGGLILTQIVGRAPEAVGVRRARNTAVQR